MKSDNGSSSQRYNYDIDGIIKVASAVRLPELQFFATPRVSQPDLVIEVAPVGGLRPRSRRSLVANGHRLVYREHLGSLASNFEIDLGSPVTVIASPLLALSRHVLYTNIVEALLRFLFIERGRMLLHAACLGLDGRGVLLSALTDTGKTSTILRLLTDRGGVFLSDDMTIIDSQGTASRYPKPLTISAHTLAAVPQNHLRARERVALYIQSRVHSRTGRSVGKRLGDVNLPIMTINAIVQVAVPPPKYMITDLVPCQIERQVPITDLFIIERGGPRAATPVEPGEAIEELITNTEDAYGFPPYAQVAPQLVIDGRDYLGLCQREREILSSALRAVPVTRLRTDDFGWASLISAQLGGGLSTTRSVLRNA